MTKEQLIEWRKLLRMSRRKAAERLGISRTTLAKYETAGPVPEYVALACAALARGIAPWPK